MLDANGEFRRDGRGNKSHFQLVGANLPPFPIFDCDSQSQLPTSCFDPSVKVKKKSKIAVPAFFILSSY